MICHDADPAIHLCVVLILVVVVSLSRRVTDVVDVADAVSGCLCRQVPVLSQQQLATPRPRRRLVDRLHADLLAVSRGVRVILELADQPLHTVRVAVAMVEIVEVGNDHRYRQGDGENSGDSAQRPDQLTPDADRHHIAVADRGHRHDGPPERLRDAVEVRVGVVGLGEVDGAGEEDDADEKEEDEQTELTHAGADRLSEDLETLGVARQLEDTEYSDETNDTEDGERHGVRAAASVVAGDRRGDSDEVRQDSHQVDHVHYVARERHPAWRRQEAEQQF